jgi:hypothetical protein
LNEGTCRAIDSLGMNLQSPNLPQNLNLFAVGYIVQVVQHFYGAEVTFASQELLIKMIIPSR